MSEISTKKGPARKRTARIDFRASEEEKAGIEERAGERNLTVGEYLIRAGLGRATRQRADVDAINLLRECRDQLKAIYHVVKTMPADAKAIEDATMDAQMAAITGAVLRVWNGENDE
jgi:uncharacterized protein (DUF1778 family)